MLPAQENFIAGDLVAADGALYLVVQEELPAFEGSPDIACHGTTGARSLVHAGFVEADLFTHALLGAIHGEIGIVEQLPAVTRVAGKHRYPQAGAGDDVGLRQVQHGGQGALQTADEVGQMALLTEYLEGDEFVTAEARHGLALAHGVLEALPQFGEQLVAHAMTEGIVDFLEAIQVDADHGHLLLAGMQGGHGFVQALQEMDTVGKAGHGIVPGHEEDFFVGFQLLGAIAGDLGEPQQASIFLVDGIDHHVRPEA